MVKRGSNDWCLKIILFLSCQIIHQQVATLVRSLIVALRRQSPIRSFQIPLTSIPVPSMCLYSRMLYIINLLITHPTRRWSAVSTSLLHITHCWFPDQPLLSKLSIVRRRFLSSSQIKILTLDGIFNSQTFSERRSHTPPSRICTHTDLTVKRLPAFHLHRISSSLSDTWKLERKSLNYPILQSSFDIPTLAPCRIFLHLQPCKEWHSLIRSPFIATFS